MGIQSEGSITFWCKHEHEDWYCNDSGYNFSESSSGPITATARKNPDGTIEILLKGPFNDSFQFCQPIPECDEMGLFVCISWKDREVKLFLNAVEAESQISKKKAVSEMPLLLTDMFKKECSKKFDISEEDARSAVLHPDQTHEIRLDNENSTYLFLKHFDAWSALITATTKNGELHIGFAVKLYPDLIEGYEVKTPLELLRDFAFRFGFPIQIGQKTGILFVQENIPIIQSQSNLMNVQRPSGRNDASFIQQAYLRVDTQHSPPVVNCALAYCLDTERYTQWLSQH